MAVQHRHISAGMSNFQISAIDNNGWEARMRHKRTLHDRYCIMLRDSMYVKKIEGPNYL